MGRTAICLAFLCVFALSGCATPYQEMGFRGGVSATQIDGNTFRITALGNGLTQTDDIQNYALMKAAQTTLAAGDDYFVILGADDRSGTAYISTPAVARTDTEIVGNTAYSNTTYSGGGTTPIFKPGQALMIKTFKGKKPDGNASAFDAHDIVQYLGPKVLKK